MSNSERGDDAMADKKGRHGLTPKDRPDQYLAGHRRAVRACVSWLHRRAQAMNDPRAKAILDAAAFDLGTDAKGDGWGGRRDGPEDEGTA